MSKNNKKETETPKPEAPKVAVGSFPGIAAYRDGPNYVFVKVTLATDGTYKVDETSKSTAVNYLGDDIWLGGLDLLNKVS